MKELSWVSLLIACAALTAVSVGAGGCASFAGFGAAGGQKNEKPVPDRRAAQVIAASAAPGGDPLGVLEQELSRVHSDRVTVPTSLLKSLVQNQRIQQSQCKNISGQLEGLKNIDLEETTGEMK